MNIKCPNGCKDATFTKLYEIGDLVYRLPVYKDGKIISNRKSGILETKFKCMKCGCEFIINKKMKRICF